MKYKALKDICEIVNGYAFKSRDFTDAGIPVIKIKNVKPNKIILDGLTYVPKEIAEKRSDYLIKVNDILLTMTGNRADGSPDSWVGKSAIFKDGGRYLLNQRVAIIRPKSDEVDVEYLSYYLSSWVTQLYFIKRANSSGGQANISPTIVGEYEIPIPELGTQKKIAGILSALDEKIRINDKINENLEQQAQAFYQQYFVTKADSDWPIGHLADLIDVKYGKDHKKLADGIYPVYGSGGIMRYVERPLYEKESVLIPRKGTLNNVIYVNQPFWSVDTMFYTEMKQPNIAKFVYHFMKSKDLASMNAGSAVPSMTTSILNAMELRIPSPETLESFESSVAPMYEMTQENETQSHKLAELRDTLLPKLMSGQLDISKVQF